MDFHLEKGGTKDISTAIHSTHPLDFHLEKSVCRDECSGSLETPDVRLLLQRAPETVRGPMSVLLYTDTDSLLLEIQTEDVYEDMAKHPEL